MSYISSELFEKADYMLRTSLYCAGQVLAKTFDKADEEAYEAMKTLCRLDTFLSQRKSDLYHWGPYKNIDGGSDGLTRWLYDHVLKYFNINPSKGSNGDQMRAAFIMLYIQKDWKCAAKIMIGFIIRLGFTPSLMEWAPLKPQAYVLLFKTPFPFKIHWLWAPIAWFCELCFAIGCYLEMKYVPVEESSTNKISLCLTMKVLGYKLPGRDYIISVYRTYFPVGTQGEFIGQSVIDGLLK